MSPLLKMSLDQLQKLIVEQVPHNHALGMKMMEISEGALVLDMPFQAQLVGDASAQTIYEGAITALIDTACGCAVLTRLEAFQRPATLDLRVDYRRPPRPGRSLRCEAVCDSLGDHHAVVRAAVHDGDAADTLATAVASFAIFKTSPARAGAKSSENSQ